MFFLPLFDDNPTKSRPIVSWVIIGLCVLIYMWQTSLHPQLAQYFIISYGVVPARLFSQFDIFSIFSSMFLHGGFMHLASNMLFLWIFGDNIEEALGKFRFLLFYGLCGLAAALTQALIDPQSAIPLIGASGGIAGILGAYIMLYPKATIRVFMWIIIFVRLINVPAWLVLGFWIGGQFLAVPEALNSQGGVAYFAHIGGFIAGMGLVTIFKPAHLPLFGTVSHPQPVWQTAKARTIHQNIKERSILVKQEKSGSVPGFKRRPKGPWDK